ncbi:hypothetical protein [Pseudonocardia humida]|uniref:WD domain-containing protein n=1 Tax=Pseudonocardia humida TaxID=2800819 RepID=A0ABT0ZXS6_9PSEU|nr:hypothetical protein [Pseudonocardia humida]MCO1655511.1 hypothetical protein [Pseudonocardia humida]
MIRAWDLDTGEPRFPAGLRGSGPVHTLAIGELADQQVIISGGEDNAVRVWDLRTGDALGSPLTGHTGTVQNVAFVVVRGHEAIVSSGADETVRVWDVRKRFGSYWLHRITRRR